jgi:hypothetical protein
MSLTYIKMSRAGFTQGQPGGRCPCLLFVLQSVITWRNEEKIPPANKRETEKKRARRMARVPKARRRRKLEIHGKELQGVEHLHYLKKKKSVLNIESLFFYFFTCPHKREEGDSN